MGRQGFKLEFRLHFWDQFNHGFSKSFNSRFTGRKRNTETVRHEGRISLETVRAEDAIWTLPRPERGALWLDSPVAWAVRGTIKVGSSSPVQVCVSDWLDRCFTDFTPGFIAGS